MIHVVLMSNRQEAHDMALPHWEPLITTDDEITAAAWIRRHVANGRATRLLWFQVTEDGMVGIKGYLDFSFVSDVFGVMTMPIEVLHANDTLQRLLLVHKGQQGFMGFKVG